LAGLKACATDGHVTSIAKRTKAPIYSWRYVAVAQYLLRDLPPP